jgi:hypothetical protein
MCVRLKSPKKSSNVCLSEEIAVSHQLSAVSEIKTGWVFADEWPELIYGAWLNQRL